jgi:hypothetical protein
MRVLFLIGFVLLIVCRVVGFPFVIVLPVLISHFNIFKFLSAASVKVYQMLSHGRWFSPGTPASSTTKTGRHDIAEALLKVALNTINQTMNVCVSKITPYV